MVEGFNTNGLWSLAILQAHYNGWDDQDLTSVMKIYEQMAGIGKDETD